MANNFFAVFGIVLKKVLLLVVILTVSSSLYAFFYLARVLEVADGLLTRFLFRFYFCDIAGSR